MPSQLTRWLRAPWEGAVLRVHEERTPSQGHLLHTQRCTRSNLLPSQDWHPSSPLGQTLRAQFKIRSWTDFRVQLSPPLLSQGFTSKSCQMMVFKVQGENSLSERFSWHLRLNQTVFTCKNVLMPAASSLEKNTVGLSLINSDI